ncbi:MAG: serine/threonine-protein kinase, partial [Nannocystaceae bacterium]
MSAELIRDDHDELLPGTTLCGGTLVVEALLGSGGVATVYRVHDLEGRTLALKLMRERRAADGDQRERFDNEWRILHALRGLPYVVTVDRSGRNDDGRPLFTMELLQAPTLADLLIDREVTVTRACRVIREVAHALADLHTRGVIHRDIKPDNIVVDEDGIRLLDFGYAYSRGNEQVPRLAGLTGTDHRPGTPLYMAPEQAEGEPPTPQFDVYGLAVSLFEALVGHAPYSDMPTALMLANKCRGHEEISIEGRVNGLSPKLVALVGEGLRRDPQHRIKTAAVFRDRLDAVLEELGDRDYPAGIQDPPEAASGEIETREPTLTFLPSQIAQVERAIETKAPKTERVARPEGVRPAVGGGRGLTQRLTPDVVGEVIARSEGPAAGDSSLPQATEPVQRPRSGKLWTVAEPPKSTKTPRVTAEAEAEADAVVEATPVSEATTMFDPRTVSRAEATANAEAAVAATVPLPGTEPHEPDPTTMVPIPGMRAGMTASERADVLEANFERLKAEAAASRRQQEVGARGGAAPAAGPPARAAGAAPGA